MNLAQIAKIVHLLEAQDHNAGVDGDSVNMSLYNHLAILFSFGELTGDAILTVNSGATVGTKTSAETFRYRACATVLKTEGGDLLAAEATSAALTLTAATYEDCFLVVEIDADELTTPPFVTFALSSAASELFVAAFGILSEPRYARDAMPQAIA